jgi:lipopolysaccharide/colanic/teichoic acid biosynthesis glycosyltransferase
MMTVESTVLEMEENQKSQNEIIEIPVQENVVLPINLKKTESTFSRIERITYFIIKRVFDILCSIFGILMLIPISLVTKICYIAVGDKKSIFYKQKRVGKNGKIIYIYKFRSMVYNADEVLKELLKDPKYRKEWDINQKFENDPRVTKIGKILRKTSLDEIPQFINVLKGDMSLIGPRPLVEGELDAHKGNPMIYQSVRPGISGWWAANGRSATTYEKRLELEYYYCKNCNLILDIKCVFLTIKAVLYKEGAK